ncbi:hypothetical protein AVEN_152587-1 [Araneus ventricosus]|uniref:Uncharacterized protein n=1 Tax=Araneus ventricosus TaxID=182803 RepID=A0A4Y2FWP2_ARAVE|nr:hypothetical protein AVEN_152587-1 [Araneus ventricosus]
MGFAFRRVDFEVGSVGDRNARRLSRAFTIRLFYSIWNYNRFAFNSFKPIHIGGSFTEAPKRTNGCFHTPTAPTLPLPHTGDFRFLERALSPLHPDSHAHSSSAHTGDLSPPSKNRILHLWPNGMNGNPTMLEFQFLPQSTPILNGISH